MSQPTSYYSLKELLLQRENCYALGMGTSGIEVEIALVVDQMSVESRRRHPSTPRYFDRPFDQGRADG